MNLQYQLLSSPFFLSISPAAVELQGRWKEMPVNAIFIGPFLNFMAGKVGSLMTTNVHGGPCVIHSCSSPQVVFFALLSNSGKLSVISYTRHDAL